MQSRLEESSKWRKGKHSIVYLAGNYAIKQFHKNFEYNFLKEVKFLLLLQPFFFVPKMYYIDFLNRRLVMERIDGKSLAEAFNPSVVSRCLHACFILDSMRIEKQEMNHPEKHIIVGRDVYFLDFDRARFKKNPSNLTQFCVYLRKFGINVEASLLREYKSEQSYDCFLKLKKRVMEFL